MKILITGGLGFIGSNLVSMANSAGYTDITVLDNCLLGKPEHIDPQHAEHVCADLADLTTLEKLIETHDVIVHLAADTTVIGSIENPAYNFDTNVLSTYNILEFMRKKNKKKMLFASTGGAITGEIEPPLNEDMPARPLSPYGASKLAAEGYLGAYNGSFGMGNCAFRFSNVYGPGSFHKGSVVAAYCKSILNNESLKVYGDGEQTRDFIHVNDICKTLVNAFESDNVGVYQLGSGKPTSVNSLIEKLKGVVGNDLMPKIEYLPKRVGEVEKTYCDVSKAISEIGYDPLISLDDGLASTWRWFSKNRAYFEKAA